MASTSLELSVNLRWWVWPYFYTALAFAYAMRPFVSSDEVECLADNVGRFIANHGMKIGAPYGHTINTFHLDED